MLNKLVEIMPNLLVNLIFFLFSQIMSFTEGLIIIKKNFNFKLNKHKLKSKLISEQSQLYLFIKSLLDMLFNANIL